MRVGLIPGGLGKVNENKHRSTLECLACDTLACGYDARWMRHFQHSAMRCSCRMQRHAPMPAAALLEPFFASH